MATEQDDFLASIKVEGSGVFETQEQPKTDAKEEETPSEPPTETKQKEEKPSQEGENTPDEENIPFHKHPRWIAMQKEREDLRKKVDELEQKTKETPTESHKDEEQKMPKWWVIANGDSDQSKEAYADYVRDQETQQERMRLKAIEIERSKEQKNKEEAKKWEKIIEDELTKLQDDGKQFDRNELLSIVAEYSPKNAEGNIVGPYISFQKAYEILELKNATVKKEKEEVVQKKKSVSSLTAPDNSGRDNDASSLTWAQLRKKGWNNF